MWQQRRKRLWQAKSSLHPFFFWPVWMLFNLWDVQVYILTHFVYIEPSLKKKRTTLKFSPKCVYLLTYQRNIHLTFSALLSNTKTWKRFCAWKLTRANSQTDSTFHSLRTSCVTRKCQIRTTYLRQDLWFVCSTLYRLQRGGIWICWNIKIAVNCEELHSAVGF